MCQNVINYKQIKNKNVTKNLWNRDKSQNNGAIG
jgi:hypothetical protein